MIWFFNLIWFQWNEWLIPLGCWDLVLLVGNTHALIDPLCVLARLLETPPPGCARRCVRSSYFSLACCPYSYIRGSTHQGPACSQQDPSLLDPNFALMSLLHWLSGTLRCSEASELLHRGKQHTEKVLNGSFPRGSSPSLSALEDVFIASLVVGKYLQYKLPNFIYSAIKFTISISTPFLNILIFNVDC